MIGLNKIIRQVAYSLNKVTNNSKRAVRKKSKSNDKNALLFNFYNTLKKIEFEPKHIVDVGANHGTWTREALLYFPDAFYTLLEPQNWLSKSFQDILENNQKVTYHPVGAGVTKGSFLFTIVDRDDSCSFRYTKEEAEKEGLEQIEIPVVTLNDLLSEGNFPIPDIIKIDAEGLDIEVLKGASNYFGKTEVFMVEAGVMNKFFDNSFLKLINFMDENGYRLFEITDLNRPFDLKILWLVELVFIKKDGIIDTKIVI